MKPDPEEEWRQERESHLEMRAEWNERTGMAPQEARRAAERAFGNRARIGEQVRGVRVPEWLEQAGQDLRYAWRGLRRSPVFTLTAVAAMAIGIGASAAVFSFADRILFRPLPYAQEAALVWFGMRAPIAESEFLLSSDIEEWRKQQTAFTAMAATAGAMDCDLADGDPVRLRCASVDAGFLRLFGLRPAAGRDFVVEDARPGAPDVVLVSHALWRNRFGLDGGVVNRTIELEGRPVRIAGVLPEAFEMPNLAPVDILRPRQEDRPGGGASFLQVFGRLRPGVTLAEARGRLEPLYQQSLRKVPPAFVRDVRFTIEPLRERQIRETRRAATLLLAAVGLVLLIAVANVANLMLARAASRRRETAVRLAMGAGRGRLVRQGLTESLLLAGIGGGVGVALAAGILHVLVAAAPAGIARLEQAAIDGRVLAAGLVVTLLAGILFGMAPALRREDSEALAGNRVAGRRRNRMRQGLVVAQVALSLVLVCAAGQMLESLWRLTRVDLGMNPDRVIAVQARLPLLRYPGRESQLQFWEQAEARIRALPGVDQMAVSNSVPPSGQAMATIYSYMEIEGRGRVAAEGVGGMVVMRQVTPGYFGVLGVPLRKGRGFREEDRDQAEAKTILDEALALRMFGAENPVGKRIKSGNTGWMEVVGVAANVRNAGLERAADPEFYMVKRHRAEDGRQSNTLLLRGPEGIVPAIREEFRQMDPRLTVEVGLMDGAVSRLRARPRFQTVLLGGFAAAGLFLAGIGLYGVMALLVAQRRREIGVRMALGAAPGAVRRMVLGQAGVWLALGGAIGLAGAWWGRQTLAGVLFEARSSQLAPVLAASVGLLLVVGLASAWAPAARASRVDPAQALRADDGA